ncbi:MAG: DHH family phosphoesterase [Halodesulfurarchaeum sp.]|nr:DHH family phosphoesterase [Halodesulfurarchaeum sp.]
MVDRLVLGCGDLCLSIARTLRDWPGRLFVLDHDEGRVEHLRDLSVTAETGDSTDPAVLKRTGFDPDVVVVLTDDRNRATKTADAVRQVFPDAYLLSLPGETGNVQQAPSVVDRVVSPGAMVLDAIDSKRTDSRASRASALRETLEGMDGTLEICTHDNPDPDALGAALALRSIASRFDVDAEICYFGDINHQENRAFVNLLDVDLRQLERPADIGGDHLALVDHSRPGINNQLPEGMPVDIVIDHHPTPEDCAADFVDIRSAVGATCTLFVDYLEDFDIDVTKDVATGLLYGIRVDTRDFGRETTAKDFEAAAWLLPHADLDLLELVESPSLSHSTLETIGRAIGNRTVDGSVLTSFVGAVNSRDSLAQAADRLLGLEAISITVVYGYTDETVHLSGRAKGGSIDLGAVFRRAFDEIGSAGGHEQMAGAQIPLDSFEVVDTEMDGDEMETIVAEEIRSRLQRALEANGDIP